MEEVVEEAEALDLDTEEVSVVGQWVEGDTEEGAAETDSIPTDLNSVSGSDQSGLSLVKSDQ